MSTGYERSVLAKIEADKNSTQVFNNNETDDLDVRISGIKEAAELGSLDYLHVWMKSETREIGVSIAKIKRE